jgi:hypothetical protein
MVTEIMKLWGSLGSDYRYRAYAMNSLTPQQKDAFRKIVRAPALTILGASTPGALYTAVGEAGVHDGLLNRFLFFFGDDKARADALTVRPPPGPIPTDVIKWLQTVRKKPDGGNISDVAFGSAPHDSKPDPIIVPRSAQALEVLAALQETVANRKAQVQKAGLGDIWVRTVEKALRLSLIAAVSDDCKEVQKHHAEWAAKRAYDSDLALEHAAEGNISDTDHGRLCNAIWNELAKHAPLGLAEGKLAGECRPYRAAKSFERKDALRSLEGDGRLIREKRTARNGHVFDYLVATKPREEQK